MAYIESAFYGDEKTQRDTTKILGDKVTGTTIDVDVNEQLIPPFEVTNKVEVTNEEEKAIKEQAAKRCGGVDQDCIRQTEATLRQNALDAKQQQANSSATAIKGRRLTVNIIDEKGDRRRIVIPDGQKFKMEDISVTDPRKGEFQVPSMEYIRNQFKVFGTIILGSIVYVFGVAATYVIFSQRFDNLVAIPVTAISVFIPYSGYVMIFLYFMFKSAVDTYLAVRIQ